MQRAVRSGDPAAVRRVAEHHPDGAEATRGRFALSAAQLVVAREYGFASWPRLKEHVEVVTEQSPPTSASGDGTEGGEGDDADAFCRLACLTYSDDDPARRARARQLLADNPDLTSGNIWAAAAATNVAEVQRLVTDDPALATQRGGPHRWTPLFYLAYSRLDPDVPAEDVLTIARLLLDAGADPNESYLSDRQTPGFTLLTGVFGEGESGPQRQPRHPCSLELARLLLDAGADPNDSQSLYNRMFEPGNDHLELLFEYGLGTSDSHRSQARQDESSETPAELLRDQLHWAVEHGFADRVRLLIEHGVDIHEPYDNGRTPAELAQLSGNAAITEYLESIGAAAPELDPIDELTAAVMRADRSAVDRLRADQPTVVDDARSARPGFIVWAAANGRTEVVALLAELGFDVNARGRGDVPADGRCDWETALHQAALHGHLDAAQLLISLGADPNARDTRFNSTPLGWARHESQDALAELLAPITDDD